MTLPDPILPPGKCLETRVKDGLKWRRYRTPTGAVYTTYEIPTEIFHGVVPASKFASRVESWYREQRRKEKRALVERLLREGWKPLAIASEVGWAEKTVTKIRSLTKEKTWQHQNQK
jgi:hypothetical protein